MKDISLSTLWRNQAMSSDPLFDQTPQRWHRVERAKEMLRSARMRVLVVAIACGFETQQHFAVYPAKCAESAQRNTDTVVFWRDKPVRDIGEEPSNS